MTTSMDRAGELGAFLRTRRERVMPSDVGLPPGGRRRTPGLRREEVAQLAGIGVTWYTWLEQGRASGASDQVLEAIARVLRMSPTERHHMLVLSGRLPETPQTPPMVLRPEQTAVLARLLPFPAAVQTDAYDIVACNRAYRFLFNDLDAYPSDERNCAWLMFTDPEWRSAVVDERVVLREITAKLRARLAQHRGEVRWDRLLAGLHARSDDFTQLWENYEVTDDRTRLRRYRSPRAGRIDVHFQSLWLDRDRGERIIVMTPADERTNERLIRLDTLIAAAPEWTARDDATASMRAGTL